MKAIIWNIIGVCLLFLIPPWGESSPAIMKGTDDVLFDLDVVQLQRASRLRRNTNAGATVHV